MGAASADGVPARDWTGIVFGVFVPVLFFGIALGVYGFELGRPDTIVFDEVHYLHAARNFANGNWMDPSWGDDRAFNWEQPPLAKYQIALAIGWGGETPGVWRIPALLNGALGVAGLSVLARRMLKSDLAGVLAPSFLLLDPMWYVNSRVVLLDVFAAAPLVWAFAFAFGDRHWEPWASAVAAGWAGAAKYTADFLLPALFVILVWRAARRMGSARATWFGALLAFVVPAFVLLLSNGPILAASTMRGGVDHAAARFVGVFEDSLDWGATGAIDHTDTTHPLLWLPMVRPTWYYAWWGLGVQREQEAAVIYALGNPVMWWAVPFLAVVFLVPSLWRILRSLREAARAPGTLLFAVAADDRDRLARIGGPLALFLCGYAVFFLVARPTFLYHMTLLVPYLALLAAAVTLELTRAPAQRLPKSTPEFMPTGQADLAAPMPGQALDVLRWARTAWFGPWPGRVLAAALVLGAATMAFVLAPLYTGDLTTKAVIDDTWRLVPWMTRSLPFSPSS